MLTFSDFVYRGEFHDEPGHTVTRVQVLDAGDNVLADTEDGSIAAEWRVPHRFHAKEDWIGSPLPENYGGDIYDEEHNPNPQITLPEALRGPSA